MIFWTFLVALIQVGLGEDFCPSPCLCNESGVVQCAVLGLTQRPSSFPANITTLNLNHNKLRIFSTEGLQTSMLQSLTLRNNSITAFIDYERKKYPNLEELDLSMNELRWIQMGLFQRMRNLQTVNLSHNKILSLSSFRIPPFVWHLDLSFNKIEELPSHHFLKSARNLMELDLSNNQINDIQPNTFVNLAHLGMLNLNGNKIRELRNHVFDGLKSCYKIGLRDNLIDEIRSNAFFGVGLEVRGGSMAPKIIDLRNNLISIVLADWVESFGQTAPGCEATYSCNAPFRMLLKSNPIYCDCNMQQVRDLYQEFFADLDDAMCANDELDETTIANFHDEICCHPQVNTF